MKLPDSKPTDESALGSVLFNRGWNECLEAVVRLNSDHPQVGETWFVQVNQRVEVTTMKVIEITDKTIVLLDAADLLGFGISSQGTRYVRSKITFLEKLAEAPPKEDYSASVAAIKFAVDADDGMQWLRNWNEGEFEICRREWPEAPDECYIGADPLFVPKI